MIESSYTPPVFHVVHANSEQIETILTVVGTLIKSNICFCIVRSDDEDKSRLWIDVFGKIPYSELKQIFDEVVSEYMDDLSIHRITVNEV